MTETESNKEGETSASVDNDNNQEISNRDLEQLVDGDVETDGGGGETSTLGTIFLIINAALGAGLLNFPKAFDTAGGVLVAVLVQAILLVFIMSALIILAKTSDIKNSSTLQDIMGTVAGRAGTLLTSIIVTIYTFGTCITFLIIIGDQFDRAFASLVGPQFCDHWYLNRDFIVPITSVFLILPLCFTKRIDFLKYVSMLGVLTIVYVVMLIVGEYITGHCASHPGPVKTRPDDWLDVMTVVPVICFGYQCHVSVIPIYSCMKHRNIKHFTIASSTAILVCCLTYTGAATFGYLTFGGNVADDILLNYSATQPTVMVALIAMAAKTYTTYPILLFCGREALSTIIKDCFIREDTERKEMVRRYTIAIIWFIATLIFAIEVPDIGIVINLLGSLAAVFIFIFPGVCLWQTTLSQNPELSTTKSKAMLLFAGFFLTLGAFLFGCVLTQAIMFNLSGNSKAAPLCIPKHSSTFSMTTLMMKFE